MEYKSIQVDKDIYDKISALAKANGRTIKGQLRIMVANIDFLPHPADAISVPVITIEREEPKCVKDLDA